MHDFWHFWWQSIALNARKTLFRLRRGGASPCQAHSDSGRAFETHCEACSQWNRPGRFRRICPALQWTAHGWRCSVDAADVRPYWGRAIGAYAFLFAIAYLTVTLAVFATMHRVGFRLGYADIAWPPAWRRFDAIRGQYYFEKGKAALAGHRTSEALVSLDLAYGFDPANYDAGLTLAQLWQSGHLALADRVYRRLMQSHPMEAGRTARAWAEALLWRGDFSLLAKLARERLIAEPPPGVAWLHALIASARILQDATPLVDGFGAAQLPAETRSLLRLESAALGGDAAGTLKILTTPLSDNASAYARYYQLTFLIEAGEARRALELLVSYGEKLPPDERVLLSLRALTRAGERGELQRQFEALLRANPQPRIYELLAAHLVRHPDAPLLRLVCGQFATMPWSSAPTGSAAGAALFCAAGVSRETSLIASQRTHLRRAIGAKALALDRAEEFFGQRAGDRRWGNFLPTLPMLPAEVVYALFETEAAEARKRRQPYTPSSTPTKPVP